MAILWQCCGNIGKLLNDTAVLEINLLCSVISLLTRLKGEVIKDLFTDQLYGYKIVSAITSENIPKDLALLEMVQLIIPNG